MGLSTEHEEELKREMSKLCAHFPEEVPSEHMPSPPQYIDTEAAEVKSISKFTIHLPKTCQLIYLYVCMHEQSESITVGVEAGDSNDSEPTEELQKVLLVAMFVCLCAC